MKKLSNQLSFESLLEEDVPLKPHIVMWGDPRWDAALVEMSTAPHVGIDIEFWADADGDPAVAGDADGSDGLYPDDDPPLSDEEDPANTIIRLVQVALPSGLCVVADFGGGGHRVPLRGTCRCGSYMKYDVANRAGYHEEG